MESPITIVFVHGWAGSAESWIPVRRLLEHDPDLSLHFVRLPGSPGRERRGEPTVAAATAEVLETLRDLGEAAVLVGHSMGAQVTLRAHAEAPALIRSEIVIDPAYGAGDEEYARHVALTQAIEGGDRVRVGRFFESATEGLSEELRRRVLADFDHTSLADIARYLRSEYLDDDAVGMAPASIAVAARRRSPVLALHSSGAGAAREAQLPAPEGSRVDVWPGHAHYLHLQDAPRFAELVRTWVHGG